jgi:hypothetical protein
VVSGVGYVVGTADGAKDGAENEVFVDAVGAVVGADIEFQFVPLVGDAVGIVVGDVPYRHKRCGCSG